MEIIIAALIAGATAAAKDTAGQAVKDAYKGLKDLIKNKFAEQGKEKDKNLVDDHEEKLDSEAFKALLKEEFAKVGIDKDDKIIEKAQQIMEEEDPEGASTGKYDLRGAKGVQVGNQNTQTNTFS